MIAVLKCIMLWTRQMPEALTPGTMFEMGTAAGLRDKCRWRVRRIQDFWGIAHAIIEQPATGKSKTVAVSSILKHPKFRVVSGQPAAMTRSPIATKN
jgi:hypothetical protein